MKLIPALRILLFCFYINCSFIKTQNCLNLINQCTQAPYYSLQEELLLPTLGKILLPV